MIYIIDILYHFCALFSFYTRQIYIDSWIWLENPVGMKESNKVMMLHIRGFFCLTGNSLIPARHSQNIRRLWNHIELHRYFHFLIFIVSSRCRFVIIDYVFDNLIIIVCLSNDSFLDHPSWTKIILYWNF